MSTHDEPVPWPATRLAPHQLLPGDLERLSSARPVLRRLYTQHLVLGKAWTHQSTEGRVAYLQAAKKHAPFLNSYENAWPAWYFSINIHRSFRKQRQAERPSSSRKTLHNPLVGESRSPGHAPAGPVNANANADPGPSRKPGGSPSLVAIPRADPPRGKKKARGAEPAKTKAHVGCGPGTSEILGFLRSIDPTLVPLVKRFTGAGVRSRAQLVVLSRWKEGEQELFLSRDLRLNAYEMGAVRQGLKSLCAADEQKD